MKTICIIIDNTNLHRKEIIPICKIEDKKQTQYGIIMGLLPIVEERVCSERVFKLMKKYLFNA